MRRSVLWLQRCLALGHYAWGVALLLLAAWIVTAAFLTLPHMSTGTLLTNLPTALLLAAVYAGPLGMLGAWMMVLGHRIWTDHARIRTALIVTHGLLLVPGALATALGVYALRAAARSAAQGGGLLSPVAVFPLAVGLPVVVQALCSIALALTVVPADGSPKRNQE